MNAPFLRPVGCPVGVEPVEWRKALLARIEDQAAVLSALVDALDAMDGDADAEPWLGAPEAPNGSAPWGAERTEQGSQLHWANGDSSDVEEENEHGGDVQDEPHDLIDEGNADYSCPDDLGTPSPMSDDDRDAAWVEAERLVAKARAMLPAPTILQFQRPYR